MSRFEPAAPLAPVTGTTKPTQEHPRVSMEARGKLGGLGFCSTRKALAMTLTTTGIIAFSCAQLLVCLSNWVMAKRIRAAPSNSCRNRPLPPTAPYLRVLHMSQAAGWEKGWGATRDWKGRGALT